MKITIYAQPSFYFALADAELQALLRLAETHYDWRCKGAAAPNGFLGAMHGWRVRTGLQGTEERFDLHKVDTCLKILENPLPDPEVQRHVSKLRRCFWQMFDIAKREILPICIERETD